MKTDFEAMGGSYHWEGDYLIPDVAVPEMPNIGIWGQRRKQYLMDNRKPLYTAMLLSGNCFRGWGFLLACFSPSVLSTVSQVSHEKMECTGT